MDLSGTDLVFTALSSTGAGAWVWDKNTPDALAVQWSDDDALQDIRGFVDDENWRHLTAQLQQALVGQQTFRTAIMLNSGDDGRHQLQLLGGLSGSSVVGLCWLAGESFSEDGQSQWAPLAKLSHELRSPLAAIAQQMRELQDRTDDAASAERLASLHESAVYMLHIIEDMLNAFRAGKPDGVRDDERVSSDRLVGQLVPVAEEGARRKGLALRLRRDAAFPSVFLAEQTAVRRILQNLLDNALKYTQTGQITLALGVDEGLEGSVLRFDVEDTGPGMTRGDIVRAFEPFAQGHAGRRRSAGLGIGLALSRQLARGLNGDLEVRSTPGEGSRFRLTIPARVPDAEDPPAQQSVDDERIVKAATRVLLVDDQPLLSRLTARTLTRLNCEVDVAGSAAEALTMAIRRTPDLIILDLELPDMSGCDLCRELARHSELAGCRFVAYSGSDEAADRLAAEQAGFHAFFVKPATAEELLGS